MRQRKLLARQLKCNVGILHLILQSLQRRLDHLLMIKRNVLLRQAHILRKKCKTIIRTRLHGKPLHLRSVIARHRVKLRLRHQRHICHRDHAHPRISPDIAKRIKLLHINIREIRLFLQLSCRRFLQRLLHLHKAAGDRPLTKKRMTSPLDHQKLQRIVLLRIHGKDQHIHRNSRLLIAVRIILPNKLRFC